MEEKEAEKNQSTPTPITTFILATTLTRVKIHTTTHQREAPLTAMTKTADTILG